MNEAQISKRGKCQQKNLTYASFTPVFSKTYASLLKVHNLNKEPLN